MISDKGRQIIYVAEVQYKDGDKTIEQLKRLYRLYGIDREDVLADDDYIDFEWYEEKEVILN